MPDTVVPLVRRAVRRTSTTTTAADPKTETVSPGLRKLSIGGETNRRASVEEHPSPSEVRRSWAKRESPKEEKKSSAGGGFPFQEEALPPPVEAPTYESPYTYKPAFPPVSKDNLPGIQESHQKVPKTEVSSFKFFFENSFKNSLLII
jgi:hypothetical protein